jgi:hypothetical protein
MRHCLKWGDGFSNFRRNFACVGTKPATSGGRLAYPSHPGTIASPSMLPNCYLKDNMISNKRLHSFFGVLTPRIIVPFGTIVLISACLQSCCTPNPTIASLPVPLRPQETGMWCWAASGQMCMEYLGTTVQQCDEANREFGLTDCCDNPVPNACINGGWPEFDKYGFTFTRTSHAAVGWSDMQQEISCNSRPIAFSWAWTSGGGHMMVAVGYVVIAGTNYVAINDPWAPGVGDQRVITYQEYVSGSDHNHWDDFYHIVKK